MLIDARNLSANSNASAIETDVCIIGAGAAGISLALELAGAPFRVCLLESGGLDPEAESQVLSEGRNRGRKYFPLEEVRTRAFGGSTHCWQGMCLPLEAEDFETRDWIPHSGWPFGRERLLPYYERALPIIGLEDVGTSAAHWANPRRPIQPAVGDMLESRGIQLSPIRFGHVHRKAILEAWNINLYTHATVVDIELARGERRVAKLHVETSPSQRMSFAPKITILAAGGIENPRLLLACRSQQTAGLGNQHDLVGRFFMEHPHLFHAMFLPTPPEASLAFYYPPFVSGSQQIVGAWKLPAALRRDERLADSTYWMTARYENRPFETSLAANIFDMDLSVEQRSRFEEAPSRGTFVLASECEQVPNPSSRVRLDTDNDPFGNPRAALDWRLSDQDYRSARRSYEHVGRAIGTVGLGRLRVKLPQAPNDPTNPSPWPDDMVGGRHHMGTTRMHDDPHQGVVDANCQIHGLQDFFIAGSSLFPTAGSANPTHTLIALALKLADHVKSRLG